MESKSRNPNCFFSATIRVSSSSSQMADPNLISVHRFFDFPFPARYIDSLSRHYLVLLEDSMVRGAMGLDVLRQVNHTNRLSPCYLSCDGNIGALFWFAAPLLLSPDHLAADWVQIAGFIRNQFYHLLCWAFASSDLVSAMRVLHGWDDEYTPLCAWYLGRYCSPASYTYFQRIGHICYGWYIDVALRFIQGFGIPGANYPPDFDFPCYMPPPFCIPGQLRYSQPIRGIRTTYSLQEALDELKRHPIGCDIIVYDGLFDDARSTGVKVYKGPLDNYRSRMRGYHAVIMVRVMHVDGEAVAMCKMSNDVSCGYFGYAFVSLSAMYVMACCAQESRALVRPTNTLMHQLSSM